MTKQFERQGDDLIAVNHCSFLGWDILKVEETGPLLCRVTIRRRAVKAHWIPASQRPTHVVTSSALFVPTGIYFFRPSLFGYLPWKSKK